VYRPAGAGDRDRLGSGEPEICDYILTIQTSTFGIYHTAAICIESKADQSLKSCQIDDVFGTGIASIAIVRTTLIDLIVMRLIGRIVHPYSVESPMYRTTQSQHKNKTKQTNQSTAADLRFLRHNSLH
jgi:hypothetical protein